MSNDNSAPTEQLLAIMARLRDPVTGCPWDLSQTFDSITKHTIEETYELIEAIDKQDWDHVKEELGDVLLQIVFYTQMAREKNLFTFENVVSDLNAKLIRRHPHIFSENVSAETPDDVLKVWNDVKSQEKSGKKTVDGPLHREYGPAGLPALMRAAKVAKKAEEDKLKWPDSAAIIEKIEEELKEIKAAPQDKLEEEIGDALLAMVALARSKKVDPERALMKATDKFLQRWQIVHDLAQTAGYDLKDLSAEKIDEFWRKAKKSG